MNQRFRRLTDLFVDGKAVALPDGSYLWVQAINSYERDESLSDAQTARARLVMALKDKGEERLKVQARMEEMGREQMARDLASARSYAKQGIFADRLRSDPDWKERVEIILRTDTSETATPPTPEEEELLARINAEVLQELIRLEAEEREFLARKYERLDENELLSEWLDEWLERRGADIAAAEYRLTEMWYATRYCDAAADESGGLDHSRCNGHRNRVFDNRGEARSAPTRLQELLRGALDELNMVGLDPKDSASPQSSSDSPPTPSEAAASTSSTSTPTPS